MNRAGKFSLVISVSSAFLISGAMSTKAAIDTTKLDKSRLYLAADPAAEAAVPAGDAPAPAADATPPATQEGSGAPAEAAGAAPANSTSAAGGQSPAEGDTSLAGEHPNKYDRAKQWGSVNLAVRADSAARAMKEEKWSTAMSLYRSLVGLDPSQEDFYLGLYLASIKGDQWDHAVLALEDLFERKPQMKPKLAKEFIECLKKLHRNDEVKEYEAIVKKSGNQPPIVEARVKDLIERSVFNPEKEAPPPPPVYIPPTLTQEEVKAESSKYGLTYDNAFQSESIVVATYTGYEHTPNITFFKPPKANYRIEEYLKGPPLNSFLPIRFEFHEKTGGSKPANWKFDKSMMPAKGSKWIIFIKNAVPIDGMFETYQGSFGRQEYSEDNLDKILKIIEAHKGQTR